MVLFAAAAACAAVILAVILASYRRQIKKICRRLAFVKEHETNLRLNFELPFPELNALVESVNDTIDLAREVRRSSAMDETALKETITNLSHDIRTPLTSIDGYFQLMSRSDSEEERAHYSAIIKSRLDSLKRMLEELFSYAKLQDEGYEPPLAAVDFSKCVYDTVFSFYDDFADKSIEPETDFADGRMTVFSNEEAVCRTLQNIIKNALEHGLSKISLVLGQDGGDAVFRCSNDVAEPDAIDTDRVFSRFYRADSARTRSSTGLGLYIAKELAEKTGGSISARLCGNIFCVEVRFPVYAGK